MAKKGKRTRPQGGMGGMMQQIQQMQEQVLVTQEALKEEIVEATSGGGVVKVEVTGDQRLMSITITPELLEDADAEMVQDLILSAVNNGLEKSRELAAERLGPLTGGLGL